MRLHVGNHSIIHIHICIHLYIYIYRERERVYTGGDETAIVLHAFVGATSGLLLLVLLGHLRRLASHLPCSSQRSVNLTCCSNRTKPQIELVRFKTRETVIIEI